MSCFRNIFGKKKTIDPINSIKHELDQLKERIDTNDDQMVTKDEMMKHVNELMSKMDTDKDGVVSTDEYQSYIDTRLEPLQDKIDEWKNLYELTADRLEEANNEINRWKGLYEDLESRYDRLVDDTIDKSPIQSSHISKDLVRKYVEDKIIANKNLNIRLVPDSIEAKTWTFVLTELLEGFDSMIEHAGMDMINHRLSLGIRVNEDAVKND